MAASPRWRWTTPLLQRPHPLSSLPIGNAGDAGEMLAPALGSCSTKVDILSRRWDLQRLKTRQPTPGVRGEARVGWREPAGGRGETAQGLPAAAPWIGDDLVQTPELPCGQNGRYC